MTTPQSTTLARRSGLREAHAHLHALGESLQLPDLSTCVELGACLDAVSRATAAALKSAGSAPSAPFVRLSGARPEGWVESRWPGLAELDHVSAGVPVVIMSFDHHAAAANTAALRAAGLAPGVRVPPNGVVCVDDRGTPTGLLLEDAAYRAWNTAPAPTPAQQRAHVLSALRHLGDLGFVEVHDLHSQPWLGPTLADLDRTGELAATRIRSVWLYAGIRNARDALDRRAGWETSALSLAGFKVFLDGTLNSRTAWMLHPYAEPASQDMPRGKAMISIADLTAAMRLAREASLGLAVHAIGDGAVRAALDAWDALPASDRGRPSSGGVPALRIEHAELVDEADVPRFAELGVVCSVQPCHLLADVEALHRYLPTRLDRVLPLRELAASGCRPGELLWFGSDVPIVRADPADSVQAAVERRRADAPQSHAIAWDQRISTDEAWSAFTSPPPISPSNS